MTFGELLRIRREKLGLGVRELCRLVKTSPKLARTISSAYYSQIEGDSEKIIVSEIGIDKLWSIGYALKINPNSLFAITRRIESVPIFSIKDCKTRDLSHFLRTRREELGFNFRETSDLIKTKMSSDLLKNKMKISPAYLNQIENKTKIDISKIEANRFWVLGVVYDVDPLLLYVLSRGLDHKLTKCAERHKLFPDEVVLDQGIDAAQSETEKISYLEGQKEEFVLLRANRNSKVANLRKEMDNYTCKICSFKVKFNSKYIIECHHLFPIMLGKRETITDDLLSVCPTCHQIFHFTTPPLTIEEVKQLRSNGYK